MLSSFRFANARYANDESYTEASEAAPFSTHQFQPADYEHEHVPRSTFNCNAQPGTDHHFPHHSNLDFNEMTDSSMSVLSDDSGRLLSPIAESSCDDSPTPAIFDLHQRSRDFVSSAMHQSRHSTPSSLSSPRSSITPTFRTSIQTTPDTEMITAVSPKVEEMNDEGDELPIPAEVDEARKTLPTLVHPLSALKIQPQPSSTTNIQTSGTVTATAPRKRGRPRKHPLPVPGLEPKVAKGRSKTGCVTCRRRKKKCDETKPTCLNCEKNAVVCEGYPVRQVWQSGKEKAARSDQKTTAEPSARCLEVDFAKPTTTATYTTQKTPAMPLTPTALVREAPQDHIRPAEYTIRWDQRNAFLRNQGFAEHYLSQAKWQFSIPALVDGVENTTDRQLLWHFMTQFSRVLTLVNTDRNPFTELFLPLAMTSKCLMHALLALAASHMSTKEMGTKYHNRCYYHYGKAIALLRQDLDQIAAKGNSVQTAELDPIIASTLALVLNTICEGNTNGEYRHHINAARTLIRQAKALGWLTVEDPKKQKLREFTNEFFLYHDLSSNLISLDADSENQEQLIVAAKDSKMLGVYDGLFNFILQITALRKEIRKRREVDEDPGVDYQTLLDSYGIDEELRLWQPTQESSSLEYLAAQLYRQSSWVYLYRTIRPSRSHPKLNNIVNDGLDYLEVVPANHAAQSILLMPLFILGCSAFEQAQRDRVSKAFDTVQTYSGLRNIASTRKIVEKIWQIMDRRPEDSWDWEQIVADMGMDFLVT